jgi:chemotaxis protein methyltransferase CheR
MSAIAWRLIEELLETRFGLFFDDTRRPLLLGKLKARVDSLGLTEALDYYHYLRFHPSRNDEADQLKSAITNNETYFFRARHQLDALRDHIVPKVARTLTRPLRVLSAGCSSGEEAYSLAIQLSEVNMQLPHGFQVDGFDLSPTRVDQGQRARYAEQSLRGVGELVRESYFCPAQDGTYELREPFRRNVRIFQGNLVSDTPPSPFRYDVVYCRNVLIYLSSAGVARALQTLVNSTRLGGYLFVGHAESLLGRGTPFMPEMMGETVAYCRGEVA